ncbi:hypothetical protein [Christiangramia sabulilitoris]|uniref:NIPSNAP domain-containing protein n=1 Tax=Christiangramia sabulilitoris TaxID=2583991 RepID=A0A550HZM0_9FLAO|nr:hypothetical protein [Christiangramia sabulilitoris]TRO64166.1 hypothetical protein FGM01_11725 [Christiangramia sabulilitoris]
MKKLIVFILLFPILGFTQEKDESRILHMYELEIKMNERENFEKGMKKWKDCYLENSGKDNWNVWNRVQGATGTVAVTFFMDKWAEMDEAPTGADTACQSIFQTDVFPYVVKMDHKMAESMPEFSKNPSSGNTVAWVRFFRTENWRDFKDVVKEVSSTYKEAKGEPLGYWYDFIGGDPDGPDYMVSMLHKNFAGLDEEWDSPWEIYEQKHGKDKTTKMQEKFRSSVEDTWTFVYKLNENLSNQSQ